MTTDIEELIARLEVDMSHYHGHMRSLLVDSRDALRSQAERIQVLEAKCVQLAASLGQAQRESDGLRAARIAYASEFALDSDGLPDVLNVHANIRELKAKCAELERDAGWRPIETAPKDGSEVLLYLGTPWSKIEKARWYAPWSNWQCGVIPSDPAREEMYGIGSAVPTHWMPLPVAPISAHQAGSKEVNK